MTTLAIGVDLGGTNLRIAAVDSSGKVLEKITTSTQVARGRDQVIDEMCTAIQEVVGKQRSAGELAGNRHWRSRNHRNADRHAARVAKPSWLA